MVTQNRLRELFHYDPESGYFIWKISRRGPGRKGTMAGTIRHGYRDITVDGVSYRAHHLAWLYVTGRLPKNEMDHINRIKDDNRFSNLRESSRSLNMRNTDNPITNKSGVKGVRWKPGRKRWIAEIKVNGKQIQLGSYQDFDEAVCSRFRAEQRLNWSDSDLCSPAFKYLETQNQLSDRKPVQLAFLNI